MGRPRGGSAEADPSPRDREELEGLEGEKYLLEQQRPKERRRYELLSDTWNRWLCVATSAPKG